MARSGNDPMDSVVRRLDIIIGLLLDRATDQVSGPSMTSKIYRLSDLGLSASEIANITRKGNNYVGAVLGARKKQARGAKVDE
jgi:hypothetical protein